MLSLVKIVLVLISAQCITGLEENKDFWYKSGKEALKQSHQKKRIEGKAKNVILFVGDGMGVITHTLARIYKGQKSGKTGEEGKLEWENFDYSGLIKTYNTDFQVPDSAGTATALMSGVKTSLGVLGVDSSIKYNTCDAEQLKKASIPSMMNWSKKHGKKVGIISTARITHATPGAVYAHTTNRDWEGSVPDKFEGCVKDIASQLVDALVNKDLEFAMGGGENMFYRFITDKNGTIREKQEEDSLKKLRKKNIKIVNTTSELRAWDLNSQMLALFGASHMDYEADRNKNGSGQPSLEEMTRQGLNRLKKNKNGYFLMVEGGRIDHAHHLNQAKYALDETLALEKAVKVAAEMTSESDTLIMVTADHSHAVTMSGYPKRGNPILGVVFDEIDDKQKHLYMENKEGNQQPYQTISYANGPGYNLHFDNETRDWKNISQFDTEAWNYTQPATFFLPYETHGGEDVAVYARGPQAHLVTGLHEQSFLGALMAHTACVHPDVFGCPSSADYLHRLNGDTFLVWIFTMWITMNIFKL